MIVREYYETRPDGVNLYRVYSDAGYYIVQNETGAIYEDAVDLENAGYTYAETNELIVQEES